MTKKQILVVEDEIVIAEDIKSTLTNFGYRVPAVAQTARRAIELAMKFCPDLILMDIILDGKHDGIEAARKIRTALNIPIIFLTAYSDIDTLQRAKLTEPFGYILKPFKEREIYSTVEMALYKHKMEEKVKTSEQWYSTTLESIGDAVITTDIDGNVTFMNPIAETLTGWKLQDARDHDINNVMRLTNLETDYTFKDPVKKVIEKGEIFGIPAQTKIVRKDGMKIPIGDSIAPIKSHKGDVLGAVVVFQDFTEYDLATSTLRKAHDELQDEISERTNTLSQTVRDLEEEVQERKQAEQTLKKLSSTVEQTADHVIITDKSGVIEYVNAAFEKITNYTKEEVLGKKPSIIKSNEHDKIYYESLWKTILAGMVYRGVFVNRKKTGELFYEEKTITPLKDKDGNITHFVSTGKDITERKMIEAKLERAHRLESAGRVAGQIAHDFNNLLAPLVAYPEMLKDELQSNHDALQLVNEMQSAALQIAQINQQLLALGRRGHYNMEPIDLNDLIHKVVVSLVLPNDIAVHEEFAVDLLLIMGGAAQLTRALSNLILNANEAMQGEGHVKLKTENIYLDEPLFGYETIERGEYVKLTVSDAGAGIEPEILDKIFDPFFSTKKMDRMRGSGLGLSVVHGIIEDHNGYVTIDSSVGEGATFCLYFPIAREAIGEVSELPEKIKGGHEKILIVDDDPVQRRVAEQLLGRLGYKVHKVESGEAAVKYVKIHPQDLLLLDMVMAGIDGTETYRKILEFQPEQKALLLSGYAVSQRVEEAQRLGAGAFICKPVTLKSLATAVRNELDKSTKKK